MLFGNYSVETVVSNVHSIRWGVSEHCGWWKIGDRRKSADEYSIVLPANSSEALFYVVCLWTFAWISDRLCLFMMQ